MKAVLDFPIPILERNADNPTLEAPKLRRAPCLTPYQAVKAAQMSGSTLCFICGRPDTDPHHIIPRSEGGLPLRDNFSSEMVTSTVVWLLENKISSISSLLIPIPKLARTPRKRARSILRITDLGAITLRIGHDVHI